MVDRLKSKVHRHELHDRSKPHESSSAADTSEAAFCNGSVPKSLGAVLIDESFSDFVGSMIVGNLLSDNEDVGVSG